MDKQIEEKIKITAHKQWAKKHRADKAFRKVRSFSKLQFQWTGNRFESPTFLSLTVVRHYAMFNNVFSIDNDKALVEKTLEELKSKPYFQQILDLDFNEGSDQRRALSIPFI